MKSTRSVHELTFDLHSWGTKGSDQIDALPSISSTREKGDSSLVEDVVKVQEDIDFQFKQTVTRAVAPFIALPDTSKLSIDDENKTFRTRLVAFWMFTNGILGILVTNINGINTNAAEERV